MSELDVIYQHTDAMLRAESLGLRLLTSREHFVLRERASMQEYARCTTLAAVAAALDRRQELRRAD